MTLTSSARSFATLADGSVTSARGFRAAALAAGIKASGKPDLGIWAADVECVAAATFTPNKFPAAPVVLGRERLAASDGRAQAVVFNAGNANACNGQQGLADAREMSRLAAEKLGISPDLVLVASTGIIGVPMPMDRVRQGLPRLELRPDAGHQAAQAIMTTDTRPKESAVALEIGGKEVRIGAMTKGVGMIHPNMATMLAFIGTDANLDKAFARSILKRVVDRTFNMITVDGDTSTNDSCFLLANGLSGAPSLDASSGDGERFAAALEAVCTDLARKMAADGEGASKLMEVSVTGAASEADARAAARAVVGSSLVKAALHGEDPNWGRVFAAVGNSPAQVDASRAALWIGSVQVARDGIGTGASRDDARAQMHGEEVHLRVDLGLGDASARAWGCDLTEAYVVEKQRVLDVTLAELSIDEKTAALLEALPYICEFVGKTIVVKVGGSVGEEGTVLDDVVWFKRLGINPVLVHGGGPQISERLGRLGVETHFVEGRRFTDQQTLEVVHEVLMRINGAFVSYLNAHKVSAWGCNGLDGEMLHARLRDERLGLVGEVEAVNLRPIVSLVEQGYVVVIAPLAAGPDSQPLNVNADTVAGEVARALGAEKMVLFTDVPGVLGADGGVVPELSRGQVEEMLADGTIRGGMIPKIQACLRALETVPRVHVLDGRLPHALIRELFTHEGVGTMLISEERQGARA